MKSIIPRFGITPIDSLEAQTASPKLAATIYAFDVPLHPVNPYTTSAGDGINGVRVVWHFQQSDAAGNSPARIIRMWNDAEWLALNPNNPLAICREAFDQYFKLKGEIGNLTGRQYFGPGVPITNTRKAAVLAGLGHRILGHRRNPQVTTWVFDEAAAADAALYDDPNLFKRLPDAAISYAKGAIIGHENMIAAMKEIQYARVEHKGRVALIGRDISKQKLESIEKLLYRK